MRRKNVTTLKTIKAARELISTPHKWTKGSLACDSRGRSVDATDQEACRYCMAGALMHAGGGWTRSYDAAIGFMEKSIGAVATFNDTHKHKDVLAAFDAAIAKLEKWDAN